MRGITDRQKEVLNYISSYTEENSYPPTVRDISEHFGISLRAVQDHILALQKKVSFLRARKRHVLSACFQTAAKKSLKLISERFLSLELLQQASLF